MSLKIVYLAGINLKVSSGGVDHVLGVSGGLSCLGHDVHLVGRGSADDSAKLKKLYPRLRSTLIDSTRLPLPASYAQLGLALREVVRKDRPDIVYIRDFPLSYLYVGRYLRHKQIPFLCEKNTKLGPEYQAQHKRVRAHFYPLFERLTLQHSLGWCPVTADIYRHMVALSGAEKPWMIARNGIRIEDVRVTQSRKEVREELGTASETPVMVMSGFTAEWNGADRAIATLREMQTGAELWLVGARSEKQISEYTQLAREHGVSDQVKVFPWTRGERLYNLVAAADLGLSSLALDRNQMSEGQSVKVSLYVALGLPVLLNTPDPRLPKHVPFAKYINSQEPKRLAAAADEVFRMPMKHQLKRHEIRAYARERLSWRSISAETADFARTLLDGC